MAGIFGYLKKTQHFNSQKVKDILSQKAAAGFDHPALFKRDEKDMSGLGCSAPFYDDLWPLESRDGRSLLQVFGQIFLPDGTLLDKKNFENSFLGPFLQAPLAFLTELDGAFVFALLDKQTQRLSLCNDAFCNFSVYYYDDNEIFLFSTQIHALKEICSRVQWDAEGLSQYLGLGFILDAKSYYKDIHRLKPGEIIEISAQSVSAKNYIQFDYAAYPDAQHLIKQTAASICKAVEKRVVSTPYPGAAITGGFDSRVTWAIINHLDLKERVTAFTHGLKDSRDLQIAKKIAGKLNLDHKVKIFDNDFIRRLPDLWEPFVRYSEGLVTIASAHALDSWVFGSQFYNTLLDSHGGVLFRRQFMKVAEKKWNRSKPFAGQFYNFIKSPVMGLNVLKDEVSRQAERSSIAGLQACFAKYAEEQSVGNMIDMFYLYQISPYKYSAAANVQMNWLMLYHPLLNIKTFELLQRIPVEQRNSQAIYKYIINNTTPLLKSFYLENMGMPAPYFGFGTFRYLPMIYERILNQTIRKVDYSIYKKLTVQKFVTNYDLFYRMNFPSVKNILLRENDRFYEYVDKQKLEKLILYAEMNDSYRLSSWSALLTFKLFMDIFHN